MFKNKIKYFTGLLLLLALMIMIVGCFSESGSSEKQKTDSSNESTEETKNTEEGIPQKGGEAIFAYEIDVSNLDPIKGNSGGDHALLWQVYDTLIKFTPELEPKPGLAESWDYPGDRTLLLHLRKGVTFHDGTPFNAEAVKFNIERSNSEDSNIPDLKNIESVEVVDEQTVKFHLSQPDSSLLLALSDRGGMMVSPTAVKESGKDFSQHPVGAGPFKMVSHVPNGEIVYEAYEDYWQDDEPYLDKMTVKIMPEENTRILALQSGEVDYADNITAGNVAKLEKDKNLVLKSKTSIQLSMIYLNTSMAPTDNKSVRKAISLGINREALIQGLNFGSGEPAYQPFPLEYWPADEEIKIDYDPEKAKEILKAAGVQNVTINMIHYARAYEQRFAEVIKSQLNEIGIQVNLQARDLVAAADDYYAHKEPVFLALWTGRPDPQMTINSLFKGDSFYNTGGHSTDEIENLISKAANTYDQDERAKLYGEINRKAVLEEAIMIPLFFQPRTSAMKQSLKGFEPNFLGKPIFSTTWKEQ